jgi:hypothetical protein
MLRTSVMALGTVCVATMVLGGVVVTGLHLYTNHKRGVRVGNHMLHHLDADPGEWDDVDTEPEAEESSSTISVVTPSVLGGTVVGGVVTTLEEYMALANGRRSIILRGDTPPPPSRQGPPSDAERIVTTGQTSPARKKLGDVKEPNYMRFASYVAREVRTKLGPNPKPTEATRLVAWELCAKVLQERNVRRCDQLRYLTLATDMVFVPTKHDVVAAVIRNSAPVAERLQRVRDPGRKWCSFALPGLKYTGG